MDFLTAEYFAALGQVIGIDLVLAGDNAIVIGLAAAGLPKEQRNKAIMLGIVAATVMRIIFALLTTQLLAIVGLLLAGGILLLWVCWKMFRELREGHADEHRAQEALEDSDLNADGTVAGGAPKKTFAQAALQIVVADITMSLDNVLAVAGVGHDQHVSVIIIGLGLSIALMGFAATFVASLLNKHRWIAWVGLAIILYVAVTMVWEGWHEVQPFVLGGEAEVSAPEGVAPVDGAVEGAAPAATPAPAP
jgi:YjbE family integral membrane protein